MDDGKVLLIEHRVRSSGRGYWVPPGGGIEPGESEFECVRREVLEETHLDVEVIGLLLHAKHPGGRPYQESKTYSCRVIGGEASPGIEPEHDHNATYEISGVRWVPLDSPEAWDDSIRTDERTRFFLEQVREALGAV